LFIKHSNTKQEDEVSRNALIAQIENFGQCPEAIFKQPHPFKRRSLLSSSSPSSVVVVQVAPVRLVPECVAMLSDGRVVTVVFAGGRVASCQMSGSTFVGDKLLGTPKERSELPCKIALGDGRLGRAVLGETGGAPAVFAAGGWSCAWLAAPATGGGPLVQGADLHLGEVLCLAKGRGSVLVTGSRDTTVLVWELGRSALPTRGCGHDGPVTCVAVCEETHSCCSGSQDGTVILREIVLARFLRSFALGEPVLQLCMSLSGDIFAVSATRLFALNGARVPAVRVLCELAQSVVGMATRGALLVVASKDRVTVWRENEPLREVVVKGEIFAICFAAGPTTVIAAHGNGTISIIELGY
jgi:hypothetical protein